MGPGESTPKFLAEGPRPWFLCAKIFKCLWCFTTNICGWTQFMAATPRNFVYIDADDRIILLSSHDC
ncbi:hypothetical protein SUGI_0213650 [Cryptomeria japonica]|nr:hypothetical protein SUGI_0213650 [Cryptomeria japonica]